MYSLIIPCAGKSKRIKGEYYFDKCLLAVKQTPIIFNIIDSWKDYINEIIIVVNKENEKIIKEYLDKFLDANIPIEYVVQKSGSGTYFSVQDALDFVTNEKVIINWSDVCLTQNKHMFLEILNKNIVLTTNIVECRWKFKDSHFEEENISIENGIYGVYILNKIPSELLNYSNEVFVEEKEILTCFNPEEFININHEGFYDIGDSDKYISKIRMVDDLSMQVRKFNSIEMYGNIVIKKTNALNIKNYEEKWYKENVFDFTPRIFGFNPIVMERFIAKPSFLFLSEETEEIILDKIFDIAKQIHTSKEPIDFDYDSCYKEYIGKTIYRLERMDFLFNFKDDFIVDDVHCKNPVYLLKEKEKEIKSIFPKEFHMIHGDLHPANVLLTEDFKAKVIDPRGYFGNIELYGDAVYDYAKIFYGFCGMYGRFNSGDNRVILKTDNEFELSPLATKEDTERRLRLFVDKIKKIDYIEIDMKKIYLLQAIIWLSVTEYISNDVLSCLFAYLYGSKLLYNFF